ncbi:MAG: ABC transporter ATP-binding protein [Candidatus Brocadiia bacterium]
MKSALASQTAVEPAPPLDEDVVVSVRGVSKKFCKHLRRSMAYGIIDLSKDLLGVKPDSGKLRKHEFWALQDVSFDLRRGEALGLIGPNGSGKTTLLRLIAGIFPPDRGEIYVKGRVGALISLGAGFHPHMTGKENIYLNGSILGMSRSEVDEKFDSIVEFSELEDFIDTPVSAYSSGMRVRLGFAIAIHLDPDVLLVDEVLAVGDVGFRSKCYERITTLMETCAVIFVSHHTPAISRICDSVIVLDSGEKAFQGPTAAGLQKYFELFRDHGLQPSVLGPGEARVSNVALRGGCGRETDTFSYGAPLTVGFDVDVDRRHRNFCVNLAFLGPDGAYVSQCHSLQRGVFENAESGQHVEVTIPKLLLAPGTYGLSILVFDESGARHLCWRHCTETLRVKGDFVGGAAVLWEGEWRVETA